MSEGVDSPAGPLSGLAEGSFQESSGLPLHRKAVRRKLWSGWAILLLLVLFLVILGQYQVENLETTGGWVSHTHKVIATLEKVVSDLKDAETGQRGYLLTSKEEYLEPHVVGRRDAQIVLNNLERLIADNPRQRKQIPVLRALVKEKLASLEEAIVAHRAGDQQRAVDLVNSDTGKQIMDRLRLVAREMEQEEKRLLAERASALERVSSIHEKTVMASFLLVVMVATAITWVMSRYIQDVIRALKQGERRLGEVIESMPNALVVVAQDGTMELVNQMTLKLFRYAREQVEGQPVEMLLPMARRAGNARRSQSIFHEPSKRETASLRDALGVRSDGTEFSVEVDFNQFSGLEGKRAVACITDTTESVKYLSDLNRQLAESNEDLQQFVYLASHDLQEPIRNILSYVSFLKEDLGEDVSESVAESVDVISSAATRMQRLLEDLLRFSRVGRQECRRKDISLDDCIDEAIASLQLRIKETSAFVQRPVMPPVSADPVLVTQLFQNLIANAMKFTRDDPPHVKITLDEGGVFGVQDNGIGIDPEYAEQIFAPFKRLHGMTEFEGSGIGLSICKRVVEHHGGRIWVDSTPGRGAHFKFTLAETSVE